MQPIINLSLILLVYGNVLPQNHDISTLKLLQIVHRHGDRTPFEFYPTDPYRFVDTEWPDGVAGLTTRGKERMYKFGLELRKIYQQFYGDSPKDIYARSSGATRCLETAEAVLAGMYSPTGRWVWTNDDSIGKIWQPIAIASNPTNTDGLLVPDSDCPAADREVQNIYNTNEEVIHIMAENKEFLANITEKTNFSIPTIDEGYYLSDILQTEVENGKRLPDWVKDIDNNVTLTIEKLHKFVIYAFKYDWSTPRIQRLRAGLILQELTNNMLNANNSSKELIHKKVYDYSSHDTQVTVILHALKVYDDIPPTYGSAILFELHNNTNNTVKLFYTHMVPQFSITQLNLSAICGQTECTLNEFNAYAKQFFPDNWSQECSLSGHQVSTSGGHQVDIFLHNLFLFTIFVYLYFILVFV